MIDLPGERSARRAGCRAAGSFVVALAIPVLLGTPVLAQQAGPQIDDRTLGEEEQIERRLEWFYSARTEGTTSGAERGRLRLEGVKQTRIALELQRGMREAGLRGAENFWVPRGPSPSTFGGWSFGNISGRISSIAGDWTGGVLYLGTASGGLWKSTNDGLSWTQLFDTAGTMTVGAVAVDPGDPNVLWVGTGENGRGCESYFGIGLLRSADGGTTWEVRNGSGSNTLEELASFADVNIDPRDSNKLVTGGRLRGCVDGSSLAGGIYTSDDGGLNWTKRLSDYVYEIARDPALLDVLWASGNDGVYKSTDNGVTWILQTASGLPNGSVGRTEVAVSPSNGSIVYALFASGPAFWRTTDGGASWTEMSSGSAACDGQCGYNMVLRVHLTDPDIVYRGTIHIFKSVNGGASWSDLSNNWGPSQRVHQDTHAFLMHPTNPDTLYVGCDGGIWKTVDGGSSFTGVNGNLNITQFYAVGVADGDPDTICGGAQDNSSLARSASDVWDLQQVTGDGFVCHMNPQETNYAYIASYPSGGYPRVSRSSTGVFGSFFGISAGGSGIIQNDRLNWVTPYVLDPVTPSTLYLGTQRVYRSIDRGDSWTQSGPDDMGGGSGVVNTIDVNRNFPSYVYAGTTSGKVWRTINAGADWVDISTGLPGRRINDIAADPTDPDRALAVVGGFNSAHLWEWTVTGGWAAIGSGLPNVPANTVLALSDLDVVVGSDTGIFRSADGGLTVVPYMDGIPEGVVVTDLKLNPTQQILTAGSYGRGAWQISVAPVGPVVLYDSIELPPIEIDGDGDANIEPGESWSVRPMLRNGGGETATGVQATLFTATVGVTVLDTTPKEFGDILPGATALALSPVTFVVDPTIPCGDTIVFDVVDVTSTNPPHGHGSEMSAFSLVVVDSFDTPVPTTAFDEDFDPNPPSGWSHEPVNGGVPPCQALPQFDEWQIASRDEAHGDSYHCGKGPGSSYGPRDYSWLYHGGKDSQDGAGIDLPTNAVAATLTIVHWYDTDPGSAGGQVLIDAEENNQDSYVTLVPAGGYPGSPLTTGSCNSLEGKEAFQGSSGGWVTSTFDLTPYLGRKVYLAFVFASNWLATAAEGWYIDQVKLEVSEFGDPICQVVQWPGSVPSTVTYEILAPGTIEAAWEASCNVGDLPGQSYAIQVGDLDLLRSSGTYTHAPVDDLCDRASPALFDWGSGNEYYLLVPNDAGHDGGGGTDSAGTPRPTPSAVCGSRRIACP